MLVLDGKKFLISGGAGFIGSHLCDHFIAAGAKVLCVDNLLTGRVANIKHLRKNRNFSFLKHDVTKPIKITGRIDFVLHFASPASPVDYLKHPLASLLAGSVGTLNMLKVAQQKQAIFLYASSSEVYGDPLVHPQKESYYGNVSTTGPRSVYDEAKRFGEALITAFSQKTGLKIKIARIFNTYGPRMKQDDGRAVPNFVCQALKGKPVTIYGSGQQTRSLCFISDQVRAIEKLMLSSCQEPFNLGNPQEVTITTLAREIIKLTGSKSKLVFMKLPQDDPKVRRPDITKAKRSLGWRPQINLVDGLKATIAWFRAEVQ